MPLSKSRDTDEEPFDAKRKQCVKCRKTFRSDYRHEMLCVACRNSLPRCGNCGQVMGGQTYGYQESFGRKVGNLSICVSCSDALRKNGYLRPSATQKLFPDGTIKRVSPLPFAPDPSRRPRPKPQPKGTTSVSAANQAALSPPQHDRPSRILDGSGGDHR